MSDLQELIATNAIHSFNSGYQTGVAEERERIIKLLQKWGEDAGCFCCASDVAASEIIALINGEANE